MALSFEAKRLMPLSKCQNVKNTSFLHCNLTSKKNLTTLFLASAFEAKRLMPLSKREDVKNTSFLHRKLASKKNLTTLFLASAFEAKMLIPLSKRKIVKNTSFLQPYCYTRFPIEIFSSANLKREKIQFHFLKGNDNNGKSSWKMMVRF